MTWKKIRSIGKDSLSWRNDKRKETLVVGKDGTENWQVLLNGRKIAHVRYRSTAISEAYRYKRNFK